MKKYLLLLFYLLSHSVSAQTYHFDILKHLNTQTADSHPLQMVKLDNQVVVLQEGIDTSDYNPYIPPRWELWKSNGTTTTNYANTTAFYGTYRGAQTINNKLLFFNSYNMGLSDPNSSQIVKIPYAPEGQFSSQATPVFFKNKIFFQSYLYKNGQSTGSGEELMYYDETTDNTYFLKDICTTGSSEPRNLTVVGEKLFFTADDISINHTVNRELWVTDGTTDGTVKVKDINPNGSAFIYYGLLAKFGNKLIFQAYDGVNDALYVSDGTEAGTYPFKYTRTFSEIGNQSITIFGIYEVGTKAFLFINVGNKYEIWVTDGTDENTKRVAYYKNYGMFGPNEIASKDGYIFFIANETLYKTDGNVVIMISTGHITPYESSFKMVYNPVNQNLYFSHGKSIYQTTGNYNGTVLINDKFYKEDTWDNRPIEFEVVNNKVLAICQPTYFNFGKELYEVQPDTIKIVYDFRKQSNSPHISPIFNHQGKTYFSAKDGRMEYPKIFETDGTPENTRGVPAKTYQPTETCFKLNGSFYFIEYNVLKRANFTAGVTDTIKTLPYDCYTIRPVFDENKAYFFTYSGYSYQYNLWSTQGTAGTTQMICPFTDVQMLFMHLGSEGLYVFTKRSGGMKVWLLRPNSSTPELLKATSFLPLDRLDLCTSFRGKTAFVVSGGSERQVWFSDGTADGTVLVKTLGMNNSNEESDVYFTPDYFYYLRSPYGEGSTLWRSDGTNENVVYHISGTGEEYTGTGILRLCNNILYIGLNKEYSQFGFLYKYDTITGEGLLLKQVGKFNREDFLCLENNMVFTTLGNGSEGPDNTRKNYLFLSNGTIGGTQMITTLEKDDYWYGRFPSTGTYPLSEKETLVSVSDDFYNQEWFVFRICKNELSLDSISNQSKTERSATTIVSTEKLDGRISVNYYAPKSITLNPGFTTSLSNVSTSIFKAEIKNQTCNFKN
ncbi:3-coathanger stack domain-containing protein [Emticicia sp. BO119]|uniref:3-coathanger stack domain-containing protein n=1 Tax=Emticicia sp. BO119 TaxID=2757768 RepID=UPI0015EFF407|nr:3-coathanger stack domain-containing protein [Emticicia sp. BO119]MBA4853788.1 hypothetical protein [Emticicia sp. BO119]